MTDEELCKRLRGWGMKTPSAGADRIEELIEARDTMGHLWAKEAAEKQVALGRIEALTIERDEHWKSFVHWRKEADALTEQLEAARADAKEAEAYAEELEKEREARHANPADFRYWEGRYRDEKARVDELEAELNICRMAQVVMENGIAEAEKERDDYAFKLADANNTYSDMHVALSEANDKLAQAVSIAKRVTSFEDTTEELAECGCDRCKAHLDLRALLAEIEGAKG
jgi:chromosome segregation ATPase